jgi:hypothetical protein
MILSILFCSSLAIHAKSPTIVGWIDNFNGEPNDYSLTRGELPLPVEFYVPLHSGDIIRVRDAQHHIILKIGDTTRVKVTQKNSPYTVEPVGKVPSTLDHLLTWVGEWVTIWYRDEQEVAKRISAGSKGKADDSDVPPYLKLLTLSKRPNQTMQVTRGIKPLYFAWAGGTPPYHLEITRNQKTLVYLSGIPARRAHTQQLWLFKRGDYRVIVRDAKQQKSVEYIFTIVDNKPSYPPALMHTKMPKWTQLTLQAAWLAAQDRGIWAFEAYQLVAPIAQYYQPARVLRYALEKGELVVEPN